MQRMIHSCSGGGSRKQPQAASSKQQAALQQPVGRTQVAGLQQTVTNKR